jgi:sulfur-oxidizing protein SoxX
MKLNNFKLSIVSAALAAITTTSAFAQTAPKPAVDPALVEKYLTGTFGKAPAEWQERIKADDSLAACNRAHNQVSSAEAEAIQKREMARVTLPADGKFLGNWKEGERVAQNGRGGQFSDPAGTVTGGNCYACHQIDPKEVSYGTIGPSLAAYGKDRKYDADAIKQAYIKIFNAQAAVACSNMPRFGTNKVLTEQQIKDTVALLFDPESPVNK